MLVILEEFVKEPLYICIIGYRGKRTAQKGPGKQCVGLGGMSTIVFLFSREISCRVMLFQSLVSPNFYRDPVCLEACDAGDVLGCVVDVEATTVEFRIPNETWQYRPVNSAGSRRVNLAGYRSRTCLIKRQSFPKSVVQKQLRELAGMYTRFGFTDDDLKRA